MPFAGLDALYMHMIYCQQLLTLKLSPRFSKFVFLHASFSCRQRGEISLSHAWRPAIHIIYKWPAFNYSRVIT